MHPHWLTLSNGLWITHPVLQSAVVATMLQRKLHKKYPVFFAYTISEIVMFAVCFPIYLEGSYTAFFYAHWILAVISLTVGFFVIREIFSDILRPFHALKDLGGMLFTWAGFVMLLVAAVVAAASPTSQSPIVEAVLTLQRCVRVVQCGLVIFMLTFSKYLGVSRKQQSFGIMLGFGGFALVELSVVALFTAGRISDSHAALVNMTAYNLAIVTWLGYCLMKAGSREGSVSLLMPQRWDQSLSDLHSPVSADSLIPMFEGMVERAFSRNHGDVSAAAVNLPQSDLRYPPAPDPSARPSFPTPAKAAKTSA